MATNLTGKLLISMPSMMDSTFGESVVFLCAHSAEGAMGLIINKPMPGLNFLELADQLDLSKVPDYMREKLQQTPLLMGGPVEQHRGFVLHSADYKVEASSLDVTALFKLSATTDILQAIAMGKGPLQTVLALGYAGWSPGQLENEILHNGWLHCDADADLVFSPDWPNKHRRAMAKIGIDPRMLSSSAGHA
jgi:putative transcriptional regulator